MKKILLIVLVLGAGFAALHSGQVKDEASGGVQTAEVRVGG